MPTANDLRSINLGRIVPAPNAGSDTSPTYFPPRMFIVAAGAAGLAANAADSAAQIALTRSHESATSSPNTPTAVGSAGTAGLDGSAFNSKLITFMPRRAITGPNNAPVTPTVQRWPKWAKPALFVLAGVGIGAVVFRG